MKLPPIFRESLKLIAVFGGVALVIWAMPEKAASLSDQAASELSADRPISTR